MSKKSNTKKAYDQGAEAKARAFERKSPYADTTDAQFWYAGYDGLKYEEFQIYVQQVLRSLH